MTVDISHFPERELVPPGSGNVPPDAGTQLATPSPLTASCVAGEV